MNTISLTTLITYTALITCTIYIATKSTLLTPTDSATVSRHGGTWYNTLTRSPLTPPGYVFSIVWNILYTVLALVGFLLLTQYTDSNKRFVLMIYLIHLALNFAWPLCFFGAHYIGVSLLLIGAMLVSISIVMHVTVNTMPLIALLLSPYCLWLTFAAYLTMYIWWYN